LTSQFISISLNQVPKIYRIRQDTENYINFWFYSMISSFFSGFNA